jgi:phosphoribosylanthranilate isomerase
LSTVRVKICGITRLEDALAAAELGADALGFNLWPGSRRHLRPEAAREIASRLPPFVTAVGVFVNQGPAEVLRLAAAAGVAALQLHGDEAPGDCEGLGLPVIKSFRVAGPADLAAVSAYRAAAAVLLDSRSEGFGGSGRAFDWELARQARGPKPLILAGGLTPENVAEAVRAVRPWAVDVASGVESSPGIKDRERMARFIRAAREAGAP